MNPPLPPEIHQLLDHIMAVLTGDGSSELRVGKVLALLKQARGGGLAEIKGSVHVIRIFSGNSASSGISYAPSFHWRTPEVIPPAHWRQSRYDFHL